VCSAQGLQPIALILMEVVVLHRDSQLLHGAEDIIQTTKGTQDTAYQLLYCSMCYDDALSLSNDNPNKSFDELYMYLGVTEHNYTNSLYK